ncbi:glycosyltransferase family A protein [Glycomyces algeriensis]|nr:glycosyltransferase family A protein [Glycomyces algeriensis]MDA1368572.1 glycosyltransferase family A protein [Glycomyces algeriensis]MDR7352371.1 glycosyltransferase involved in cell wall biosynthesis/type IV secretory pathway TrbD component [Glycomyces algeriensis]
MDIRTLPPVPGSRQGPSVAGNDAMQAVHAPDLEGLVERALDRGGAVSVKDIHEWGQFHNSTLALHVLARLAHPEDPGALLGIRGRDPRLERAALNLEAVCALAASIALKAKADDERARALDLFDLAHRRLGGALPREYQELHVMTAHLDGRHRRVKSLLKSYRGVSPFTVDGMWCNEVHPRFGGDAAAYMRRFKQFTEWPEIVDPEPGASLSIDRLRTAPLPPVERGALISVVMTCFRPDAALLTSVRSIVAQTWQNWELLLVDDGSEPEYEPVLLKAASLDPRVKLLIQPENAGTYQARNRAMAVAAGKYITGHDSDDWAHPRRLELQVKPMLTNEQMVMVESRCLAVADDLSLMIDPQVALVAARSTPIMIRADAVLGKVGFYDEVRKTADSEYRFRIRTAFGGKAYWRMNKGPLTLVRHNDGTLSAGEVSRHWMSTSRFAYHSGFARWHRAINREQASPFLASMARPRPFPIAPDITRTKAANLAIEYGRIYAADWSALDDRRRSMLDDASRRADDGMPVGLLHCPEWTKVKGDRALVDRAVLTAAAEHGIDFVEPDQGLDAPVFVPSAAYAELLRFELPEIAADRIRLQPSENEPEIAAATQHEAAADDHAAVTTAPRRTFRRADLLLAGAGLGSAAMAVLLAAAVQPASLPWVAAGSLAVWAASLLAVAIRRTFARTAA